MGVGVGASLSVFSLGFEATKEETEGILSHVRFFGSDWELKTFAVVEASVCCLEPPCLSFSLESRALAFSEAEPLFGSVGLTFACTWVKLLMDVCFLAVALEAVLRGPLGVEFTVAGVGLDVRVLWLVLGVEASLVLRSLEP